jgi:hypothetical protein
MALNDLFPSKEGECACGCGSKIWGQKKKWFSESCRTNAYIHFAIIKGDTSVIRWQLYQLDKGACRNCGEITLDWEADHILPVSLGGGGRDISNFQTLCRECHREKSYTVGHRSKISSHALSINFMRAISAFGHGTTLLAKTSMDKHRELLITNPASWVITK